MYSLQKVYNDEADRDPLAGYTNIIKSPKLDGAAVSVTYHNGSLLHCLTRGDGKKGNLVTDAITAHKVCGQLVPETIPHESTVQIDGELVAHKDVPNSRNAASGFLGLKEFDLDKAMQLDLVFVAYSVRVKGASELSDSYSRNMGRLEGWGFNTCLSSTYTDRPSRS